MPYHKVLIAIDTSDRSIKAAEQGVNLAIQLGASVAIVIAIDTAKINKDSESGSLPQDEIARLNKKAHQTIDAIAKNFPDQAFERFIPEGKPSKEIVKIAEDWGADLIVMGTQGKSGIKRLLLGSTAENTLRHSNIPILITPSKQ